MNFKQLRAAVIKAKADKIPPGWRTVRQICEAEGTGKESVLKVIRSSPTPIPKKTFVLVRSDGRSHPVVHYKI